MIAIYNTNEIKRLYFLNTEKIKKTILKDKNNICT